MNILLCDDVLNLILKQSNNCNCAIVCKHWNNLILKSSNVCNTCNKFVKIYDMDLWTSIGYPKCHTNPLFSISLNTKYSEFIYGKCIAQTFEVIKNLATDVNIIFNPRNLQLKMQNEKKTISATLTLTRDIYAFITPIITKTNANDFYDNIKNGSILLSAQTNIKYNFEDNNYTTLTINGPKTIRHEILESLTEDINTNICPFKINLNKYNYKIIEVLNDHGIDFYKTDDFSILNKLPDFVHENAYINRDDDYFTLTCNVTTIGTLTLQFNRS